MAQIVRKHGGFSEWSGPAPLVGKYEADFDKLFETLQASPDEKNPILWVLPPGWTQAEKTPGSMRYATLKSPGDEIEIGVTQFSGSILANAQRWWGELWGKDKQQEFTMGNAARVRPSKECQRAAHPSRGYVWTKRTAQAPHDDGGGPTRWYEPTRGNATMSTTIDAPTGSESHGDDPVRERTASLGEPIKTPSRKLASPFAPVWDVIKPLASLQLTVGLFALSMVLVFFGTMAQIDKSVWTVVDQYFRSWYVWIPNQLMAEFGKKFLQFSIFKFTIFPDDTVWNGSFPFPGGCVSRGADARQPLRRPPDAVRGFT